MSIEIEQALLGLALSNNEMALIFDLQPEQFSHEMHRDLFSEILEGISNGKRVNPVTLKDRYDNAYLAGLITKTPSVGQSETMVEALKRDALRRQLRGAAQEALEAEDPDQALLILTGAIDDATRQTLSSSLRTARQVSESIVNDLKESPKIYSTGLQRLDYAMNGGFHEGRFYGFAADSGHGKSLLASTISNHMKNANVPHLLICAEMGEKETHQRSLAKDMGVDSRAFYDLSMRPPNFISDVAFKASREQTCMIYYDDPFLTFTRLQQVVTSAVVRFGIKGFILDYWQLIGGGERDRADFLGRVAQWQASACKRFKLWSMNTAQLNRDGEVLGSGGLKRAVDQMYHLIRPDETLPTAYFEMKKTRYTKFMHVGSADRPSVQINEKGGYFEQISNY